MTIPTTLLVVASHIAAPPAPPPLSDRAATAIAAALPALVAMQEGFDAPDPRDEWPYEGVYRVRGAIPFGYRVGGTAIVATSLVEAPGYEADEARRDAVARAARFVCDAIREPLMSPDPAVYRGGYDVRGWGHCYALRFLLALERLERVPPDLDETVRAAIDWYLEALVRTEIPEVGGWTYSRRPGLETPCDSSPFMTAPCLFALYEARASGRAVDDAVLERALAALERTRTASGFVAYSASRPARDRPDQIPGAIGRMVAAESALFLAGRSNSDRLRFALDRFIEHWPELEKRRRQSGTHVAPYGVAPYYFFYGFHHAALAVRLLPEAQRGPYRERLEEILFSVREADGVWNDRVFPRSANYGTALTVGALLAPHAASPAPIGLEWWREAERPDA